MNALTMKPGVAGSLAITTMPEPAASEGLTLVQTLAVGLCATDTDIVEGTLGRAPSGSELLVLGHEGLGRVIVSDDPALRPGDIVVPFVRRPDPVPCPACAVGEWDMCRNGRYTSHGITGRHGFARERWRSSAAHLVRVDGDLGDTGVLVEPASVVVKAWEQIDRIGHRSHFAPQVVVVAGAGPIGLLAALMGVRRGMEVHVVDRATDGPKPELIADLGAHYHLALPVRGGVTPDIMIECTGSPPIIAEMLRMTGRATVTCLMGMSAGEDMTPVDVATWNAQLVRQNGVVFGTVNANRRHYEEAVSLLRDADQNWLRRMLTREVPMSHYPDAFERRPDDVKVVLRLG